MTAEAQLGFFGIALLLGLSPGPDNLFVLMQSATQGLAGRQLLHQLGMLRRPDEADQGAAFA